MKNCGTLTVRVPRFFVLGTYQDDFDNQQDCFDYYHQPTDFFFSCHRLPPFLFRDFSPYWGLHINIVLEPKKMVGGHFFGVFLAQTPLGMEGGRALGDGRGERTEQQAE